MKIRVLGLDEFIHLHIRPEVVDPSVLCIYPPALLVEAPLGFPHPVKRRPSLVEDVGDPGTPCSPSGPCCRCPHVSPSASAPRTRRWHLLLSPSLAPPLLGLAPSMARTLPRVAGRGLL